MLRKTNPAPTTSRTAMATSPVTKPRRSQWRSGPGVTLAVSRIPTRPARVSHNAGPIPKAIPVPTPASNPKPSAVASSSIAPSRGSEAGTSARMALSAIEATATPRAAPNRPSVTLSISTWRSTRSRSAPRASRTSNSRRRWTIWPSDRLATLRQAISRTRPTAPSNAINAGSVALVRLALSGSTKIPEEG